MIKSLEIQNLQSHKDTHLEFSKGVNVIIGASDAGKSAVIRSLRWLIENRPLGDSIHSVWGGETVVNLKTETIEIERVKYKRDQYTLKGIADPFKAFGTKVPAEITTALNLDVINTQYQTDAHFLFSKSPGEVATFFNRIANLEVLDKARNNIEKTINDIEADIKYDKKQNALKQLELPLFEYLEKFEIELEVIESLEDERNAVSSQSGKLSTLLTDIQNTEAKLIIFKEKIKAEKDIDVVLQWINIRDVSEYEIEKLTVTLFDINAAKAAIRLKSKILKAEPLVNKVVQLIEEETKINKEIDELESFLYNIKKTSKKITSSASELVVMMKDFKINMQDTCPLCGTNLKNHNHEKES